MHYGYCFVLSDNFNFQYKFLNWYKKKIQSWLRLKNIFNDILIKEFFVCTVICKEMNLPAYKSVRNINSYFKSLHKKFIYIKGYAASPTCNDFFRVSFFFNRILNYILATLVCNTKIFGFK